MDKSACKFTFILEYQAHLFKSISKHTNTFIININNKYYP